LAATQLKHANIKAFIDSDPYYQGKKLLSRNILSPQDPSIDTVSPMLISSKRFQDEIRKQITAIGKKNAIITLYT
jgi:hypothetical protein